MIGTSVVMMLQYAVVQLLFGASMSTCQHPTAQLIELRLELQTRTSVCAQHCQATRRFATTTIKDDAIALIASIVINARRAQRRILCPNAAPQLHHRAQLLRRNEDDSHSTNARRR